MHMFCFAAVPQLLFIQEKSFQPRTTQKYILDWLKEITFSNYKFFECIQKTIDPLLTFNYLTRCYVTDLTYQNGNDQR